MTDDWSHEETDDPLHADRRNFYKVKKWSAPPLPNSGGDPVCSKSPI
jgi:hypothetical protein